MCGAQRGMNPQDEQAGQVDADDADFDSGFDDNTTTSTETPGTSEEVSQPAVIEAPAVEYVQLTKAERDDLMAIRASQEKSFGTAFGKIGGIERTLQQLQGGAQVDISQEDIDALRDDFPPLAAALEKVRSMRALPGAGMDENRLNEMVQQRIAPALSAVEQKFELRLLAKDHPDFQQIDADPAFAAWVNAQPDEFKASLAKASADYDSATVSDAMTRFKAARKPGQSQDSARRSRLQAAVTPRGSGQTHATDTDDPFDAGFNSR